MTKTYTVHGLAEVLGDLGLKPDYADSIIDAFCIGNRDKGPVRDRYIAIGNLFRRDASGMLQCQDDVLGIADFRGVSREEALGIYCDERDLDFHIRNAIKRSFERYPVPEAEPAAVAVA